MHRTQRSKRADAGRHSLVATPNRFTHGTRCQEAWLTPAACEWVPDRGAHTQKSKGGKHGHLPVDAWL